LHEDREENRYRKLVLRDGCVIGGILFGYSQEQAALAALVKEGRILAVDQQ
jgi:NAD(P)H-nitrite reductase large subunit